MEIKNKNKKQQPRHKKAIINISKTLKFSCVKRKGKSNLNYLKGFNKFIEN